MTFNQAFTKLRVLAKEEYCALQYKQIWEPIGKQFRTEVACYIDKKIWTNGYKSFQGALAEMEAHINPEIELPDENPEIKDEEK